MTADFDFALPDELIAQAPPARRGDARMLLVDPAAGVRGEQAFRRLPTLLRAGDRLVLNESRVLPARLWTRRADTGGRVEILLLRPASGGRGWLAMARPARRLKPGQRLVVDGDGPDLKILDRDPPDGAGLIVIDAKDDLARVAERWGVMPLPPYIRRPQGTEAAGDRERYQTVYARADGSGAGSVAAPTAGLHFSAPTLDALAAAGVEVSRVTLHVGPGTFQPPSEEQIAARRLHGEHFRLPAKVAAELAATRTAGGRVIAVGTTSLRVLETVARLPLAADGPDRRTFSADADDRPPVFTGQARRQDGHWEVSGETRLFIAPPDRVTAADGLLTNFHLPGSSLLMLVAGLLPDGAWRRVYEHAVAQRLRFYSYGDCMLILPGIAAAARAEDARD